jgi:hypothetical protein
MNYAFITSMDQRYYDMIGSYMIKSFIKYAPKDFTLHLYAENITSELPNISNLKIYDWNTVCREDWDKFAVKTDDNSAKKFGKKGWASIHAWENIDADYLIWLDADLLFHKSFDESVIRKTIKKNMLIGLFNHEYLAHVKNEKPIGFSAETGYVILNKRHKDFDKFVQKYRETYELDFKPSQIVKWWDNQICMYVANMFKEHVYDLSSLRLTDKTQTPLNRSELTEYFSHQKGKSKKKMTEQKKLSTTGIEYEDNNNFDI